MDIVVFDLEMTTEKRYKPVDLVSFIFNRQNFISVFIQNRNLVLNKDVKEPLNLGHFLRKVEERNCFKN